MQMTYKIRLNGVRNSTVTLTNINHVNDLMEDLTKQGIAFTFHSFKEEQKMPTLPTLGDDDAYPLPPLPKPRNGVSV